MLRAFETDDVLTNAQVEGNRGRRSVEGDDGGFSVLLEGSYLELVDR